MLDVLGKRMDTGSTSESCCFASFPSESNFDLAGGFSTLPIKWPTQNGRGPKEAQSTPAFLIGCCFLLSPHRWANYHFCFLIL